MNERDKSQALQQIKTLIKGGEYEKAFTALKELAQPEDDFVMQSRYAGLFSRIRRSVLHLEGLRLAILAGSTVDHLAESLRFWLAAAAGREATIYRGQFDTVHQAILDEASGLYDFRPEITMIFNNYRDVRCEVPPGSSQEEIETAVKGAVEDYRQLWRVLQERSPGYVLQNNADLPAARVFGNYEGTALWSRTNVLRRFNLELAGAAAETEAVTVFDLEQISALFGKGRWHDERMWHYSRHAFGLDATGLVAFQAAKVIGAIKGKAKKCLVLDLDNTLWGGIIGDDGIEGIELGAGINGGAFVEFQKYLLKLKQRGIILAVCSKNDEEKAKEPFLKHPDMQLHLDDIAVFTANWQNKADNIRSIAAALNLGLDALVFVDDNPAERELVRQMLPMVSVPELPADPTGFIAAMERQAYFETVNFSREDADRGNYYRGNAQRADYRGQFTDLAGYLRGLEMLARVVECDEFSLPRMAQLINKSNQFHLTTTRYTEGQIRVMLKESNMYCLGFELEDKFGSNGLIAVVILEKRGEDTMFIDTWVMSCRVLARGMEEFIMREVVELAGQLGCQKIMGKYIPSPKNQIVAGLYDRLGFHLMETEEGYTLWLLDRAGKVPQYETFIRKAQEQLAH